MEKWWGGLTTNLKSARTQVERLVMLMLLLPIVATGSESKEAFQLASPDGTMIVTVSLSTDAEVLRYSIAREGESVIAESSLGIKIAEAAPFGSLVLKEVERRSADAYYPMVVGKAAVARDHFNELIIGVHARSRPERRINVEFRAYDDGVAFRYKIPSQPNMGRVLITGESTEFNFSGDYSCWGFNVGRTESPYEGEYDSIRASHLRSHFLYDVPLVCRTTSGSTSLAIAEADLQDYGALYLSGRIDGSPGVVAQLSMRRDLPEVAAVRQMTSAGIRSPWRVVMMADQLGELIPSNLIANLSSASKIDDPSWIKPGKAAWYWFIADAAFAREQPGMNMPTLQRYIDFAGDNGFEYMLIDIGWSLGSDITMGTWEGFAESLVHKKPQRSDLTRSETRLDIPALVERARKLGVGLIAWVHWEALDRQLDAAFAQFEKWGLKGVKVDFMNRSDQEMVEFYHRVLRKAAKHKLLVDFHSAYHPTGLNRTWPNLITQEGVLGSEWNVISRRVTATHNVTLPYTRMLLGPMDYTPGLFRNVSPGEFIATDVNTMAQYTRGQALAMYVVYDSPLQMLADTPNEYQGAAGFEFLKRVPTTWDETVFVEGQIGESIALARRKGNDWFIGAMTNEKARIISVPLQFLKAGRFTATTWSDGDLPTTLVKSETKGVTSGGRVSLQLAPSGGAVVIVSPEPLPGSVGDVSGRHELSNTVGTQYK